MATWYWTDAEGNQLANDLGNWIDASGSVKPTLASHLTTGDLIFRSAVNTSCNFNQTTCKSITVEVGFTSAIHVTTNVALEFASFKDGVLDCGSAITYSFSNGANLNSESTFIEFGDNLTYSSGSRANLTFELTSTQSTPIKISDGLYPKLSLASGKFSTQYVTPNANNTNGKVDVYALTINSSASLEQIAINSRSVNDRDKHFYLATNSLTISSAKFHCGESKWTLQGHTTAAIMLPFFNGTITTFRMRHLVLDNQAGAGSMFQIPVGANLTLDSLVINEGVVLTASDGCVIRCSSKPNIKGSWSFNETSQGVYLPKDEEYLLGVRQGGTGLRTLGSNGQVLTSTGTAMYWASSGAGSSSVIDIGPLTSASSPSLFSKVVFGSLTV